MAQDTPWIGCVRTPPSSLPEKLHHPHHTITDHRAPPRPLSSPAPLFFNHLGLASSIVKRSAIEHVFNYVCFYMEELSTVGLCCLVRFMGPVIAHDVHLLCQWCAFSMLTMYFFLTQRLVMRLSAYASTYSRNAFMLG